MATRTFQPFRHIRSEDGKPPEMETLTGVTAINPGELLVEVDGALTIAGDAAEIVTHLAVCDSDDQVLPGSTAFRAPAVVIKRGDVFECNAWSATPANAVIADSLLDAQGNWAVKKATVGTVTEWALDIDTGVGTTPAVRLIGRSVRDSATDLYPRVYVQFLKTVTRDT